MVSFFIAGITPGEHEHLKLAGPGKPFFRLKSYIVGTVHGLAGSAVLMLLALTTLRSIWTGIFYILLFGLGSVASMGFVTIFLSFPFTISARLPRLNRLVQGSAGALSIIFGLFLMYDISIAKGLFLMD